MGVPDPESGPWPEGLQRIVGEESRALPRRWMEEWSTGNGGR